MTLWAWVALGCAVGLVVFGAQLLRGRLRQWRVDREITEMRLEQHEHGMCFARLIRNRKGEVVDMRRVPVRDLACFAVQRKGQDEDEQRDDSERQPN